MFNDNNKDNQSFQNQRNNNNVTNEGKFVNIYILNDRLK